MVPQTSEYPEWAVLKRQISLLGNRDWRIPFTIAFCGGFSAGKSSLINAILNCSYRLPTGIMPITKVVTHIYYGEILRCSYQVGGQIRTVTGEQASQMIRGETELPQDCKEVTIELPAEILKNGVHFLDTPGFNDEEPDGALERMSQEAILSADYVVFCTNSTKCGGEFERDFLSGLQESKGNFCLVVNRMDSLNTDEDMADIQAKATWLMNGKGRLGLCGKTENVFYTVADGRRATLGGFDTFLNELISHEGICRRIRLSTADCLGNFVANYLEERLSADVEQAERLYTDIRRQHEAAWRSAHIQAELDVQRVTGELSDCKNRTEAALEKLETEYSKMLTRMITGKNPVSSYPQDFIDQSKTCLTRKVSEACNMIGQAKQGSSVSKGKMLDLTINGIRETAARFTMPKIKPTWVKKRGLLGRAVNTLVDSMNYGFLFTDDGTDPEYRDYHRPIIQKVSRELLPKIRAIQDETLNEYHKTYAKKRMDSVSSGLEHKLSEAESNLKKALNRMNEFQVLQNQFDECTSGTKRNSCALDMPHEKTIFVTGSYASGRMTLVNALLGRRVIFELGLDCPITISYNTQPESATITYRLRSEDELSLSSPVTEKISTQQMQHRLYELLGTEGCNISHVKLSLNTPKMNTQFVTKVFDVGNIYTNEALLHTHAVVYVMPASNCLTYTDMQNIKCIMPVYVQNLFLVIGGINCIPKSQLESFKRNVYNILQMFFLDNNGIFDETLFRKRVFYVNAYESLCSRIGEPVTIRGEQICYDDNKSGIPELEHALYSYLNSD